LIKKGVWKGKVSYKKKSGREIILETTVSAIKNEEAQITGYVGIHRDVTECSKTKTDLSTLLSTLSNIDDNFFIVDKDLRMAFIDEKSNQNLRSFYGITYNEGDHILEKMPLERKQQVMQSFTNALKGSKTSYEVNIKNVAGKSIWLQGNYFPIKEHDGTISHACLIVRDITTHKEVELVHERLYQSRKLFETFMENSPILSWITDVKGIIRYLNPAYLKTYHLMREDIGKSIFDIFPNSIAQHICENNELVIQTNQPIKTIERGITPDQKEHIYQVVKFPVHSDEETYIAGWAIDLTEEIALRENLNKSLNDLRRSDKELKEALEKEHQLNHLKSSFVSMASHEFRTPLSTMLSSIFLLEKYSTTEQQGNRMKHAGKIKESIHQMNALLEDFLSLGKLDEDKTVMTPSNFNLPELISEVIEEIEPIRRLCLNIFFISSEIKEISSDKKLIRNILVNLLSNACKFSKENKRIWLKAEKCKDELCISVIDEGIGICKEDQKHLFETFFRGRNVQNIQGTGLGLHIIKRYTELLRGRVDLQSQIEKGTTVTLSLPLEY
jgi:PAS domain S-box-containing protein